MSVQLDLFSEEAQQKNNQEVKKRMEQLQRMILVHSCIYYRLNDNLISDRKFDNLSQELVELQNENPEVAKETIYYNQFKDFNGTTGFDLDYGKPEIVSKAKQLLNWFA